MKTKILFLIIVLIIVLGAGFYLLPRGSPNGDSLSAVVGSQAYKDKKFPEIRPEDRGKQDRFDYEDGEKPWTTAVPTYYPSESEKYLPVWKQVFQALNGISDDYFKDHIFVVGTSLVPSVVDGKAANGFSVTYYHAVDWAHIKLRDYFTFSLEGAGDGVTPEELRRDLDVPSYQTKYRSPSHFNRIKPLAGVATKEQLKNAVANASPYLWIDVNKGVLGRDGQWMIRLFGVIDDAANRCESGTVMLENAQVSHIGSAPCRIY